MSLPYLLMAHGTIRGIFLCNGRQIPVVFVFCLRNMGMEGGQGGGRGDGAKFQSNKYILGLATPRKKETQGHWEKFCEDATFWDGLGLEL